ncbi:MAG: DNA mismatch repair endonuclease MutL [Kiritimatiellae bacterium]|nr:DNA mismatch repair endonuclease MutL [Kiritimatiellia bacterium]MDW8458790.1 DNA mismatch repair endonuclease MutL [Verrucomicrobiota bacterium]
MGKPTTIRVLPDAVINKIAAGEVVERPASVVKELVENSIDAGASSILVDLVGGGKTAVVVSDDGAGMTRDDALLSIERHATSKIRDISDIERISTLGFRGEALAAVAAVSRFTLTTRPRDEEAGTEITVSGGTIVDVREVGCAPGTTVSVKHLFFNVPARRKFLRSEQTELAHARQVFLVHALAHTGIAWTLRVDEREVCRLPGGSTLEERLRDLFGPDFLDGLRRIEGGDERVRVRGFASLPQVNRADRSEQYIFVNGRPATAAVISYAVAEAYNNLIPRGRHPVLFLFIDLPPTDVDVNVHPTKKEVRFRNVARVRDALLGALREALALGEEPLPRKTALGALLAASRALPAFRVVDLPELPAFSYPRLEPSKAAEPATGAPAASSVLSEESRKPTEPGSAVEGPSRKAPWSWCRILGQAGGLYVVLETEDGLILMDPHAAHERVMFEQMMRSVLARDVRMQGLLAPETVDLPPEAAQRVRDHLPTLRSMGFGVAEFGGDTFVVDALPTFLGPVSPRAVLAEVTSALERGGRRAGAEHMLEEQIAMAACKAAVKARDRLTVQEIERLVQDLAACEMPYTCPHGRPTLIYMGFDELRRKFGRE